MEDGEGEGEGETGGEREKVRERQREKERDMERIDLIRINSNPMTKCISISSFTSFAGTVLARWADYGMLACYCNNGTRVCGIM